MDTALPRSHLINTTQARQEDKRSAQIDLVRAKKRQLEQDYPVYSPAKKGTKWRKTATTTGETGEDLERFER
jgi:hypothetical protein